MKRMISILFLAFIFPLYSMRQEQSSVSSSCSSSTFLSSLAADAKEWNELKQQIADTSLKSPSSKLALLRKFKQKLNTGNFPTLAGKIEGELTTLEKALNNQLAAVASSFELDRLGKITRAEKDKAALLQSYVDRCSTESSSLWSLMEKQNLLRDLRADITNGRLSNAEITQSLITMLENEIKKLSAQSSSSSSSSTVTKKSRPRDLEVESSDKKHKKEVEIQAKSGKEQAALSLDTQKEGKAKALSLESDEDSEKVYVQYRKSDGTLLGEKIAFSGKNIKFSGVLEATKSGDADAGTLREPLIITYNAHCMIALEDLRDYLNAMQEAQLELTELVKATGSKESEETPENYKYVMTNKLYKVIESKALSHKQLVDLCNAANYIHIPLLSEVALNILKYRAIKQWDNKEFISIIDTLLKPLQSEITTVLLRCNRKAYLPLAYSACPLIRRGEGKRRVTLTIGIAPNLTQLVKSGAATSPNSILVDIHTGKTIRELKSPRSIYIDSFKWSPDGKNLAALTLSGNIWIWDMTVDENPVLAFESRENIIKTRHIAWAPEGNHSIIKYDELEVILCTKDLSTGDYKRSVLSRPSKKIASVQWSPDGKRLLQLFEDNSVEIWDMKSQKKIADFPLENSEKMILAEWMPDGKNILLCSSEGKLYFLNVENGTKVLLYNLEKSPLYDTSISLSPDKQRIALSFPDKTVVILPLSSDKHSPAEPLYLHLDNKLESDDGRLDNYCYVKWSPDGSKLFSYSSEDTLLHVWDSFTGTQISASIKMPAGIDMPACSLEQAHWASDGNHIVIICEELAGRPTHLYFADIGSWLINDSTTCLLTADELQTKLKEIDLLTP